MKDATNLKDAKLVALVKATRKGEKVVLPSGRELGGTGKGEEGKWYEVKKLGVGRWACTCMAYRFSKGKLGEKAPCKHMLKVWHDRLAEGVVVVAPEAL